MLARSQPAGSAADAGLGVGPMPSYTVLGELLWITEMDDILFVTTSPSLVSASREANSQVVETTESPTRAGGLHGVRPIC